MRLLTVVMIIFICACSRPQDFDIPYDGDKIVINAAMPVQQIAAVRITRSYSPNASPPDDVSIADANVMFYEDNVFIESLVYRGDGLYESPSQVRPVPGRRYRVRVEAPGLDVAESENTIVPSAFPLDALSSRIVESGLNEGQRSVELNVTIRDNGATQDYFLITVDGYADNDPTPYKPTMWIPGDDGELQVPCNLFRNGRVIYEDKCFNGESYKALVGVETTVFTSDFVRKELTRLEVTMQAIPSEYFEYLKSSRLVEGLELGFFEPPFLYSNVRNGYGIFTSCNARVEMVEIP